MLQQPKRPNLLWQVGLMLVCMVMQTLERSYLLRINGAVVERPQHMLMRVAVGIHKQVPSNLHCEPA